MGQEFLSGVRHGGRRASNGDLVDSLTRSGSFAFLSELFDTERLFELRDFRISRVMSKDEAVEQLAASMHLVLDLADKCTHFRLRSVLRSSSLHYSAHVLAVVE